MQCFCLEVIMSVMCLMLSRFPLIIASTRSILSVSLKNQCRLPTASSKQWRITLGAASATYATGNNSPTCPVKEDLKRLSEEDWAKRLTPEQFHVCRRRGTEPPFTGKYYTHSESGTYTCSCCGASLFSSETKFDSGSGWPSFSTVLNSSVIERTDRTGGMSRTEVLCAECNSHLGHVFTDGPQPTGLRYCINSVCLDFVPTAQPGSSSSRPGHRD